MPALHPAKVWEADAALSWGGEASALLRPDPPSSRGPTPCSPFSLSWPTLCPLLISPIPAPERLLPPPPPLPRHQRSLDRLSRPNPAILCSWERLANVRAHWCTSLGHPHRWRNVPYSTFATPLSRCTCFSLFERKPQNWSHTSSNKYYKKTK